MQYKLENLWQMAWHELHFANQNRNHPFRTAVVSTSNQNGFPNARTVVMREAKQADSSLLLYTDSRSQKVTDWQSNQQLHWLFWHTQLQLQIGGRGLVKRLDRSEEVAIFNELPKYSRKSYATLSAPAQQQTNYTDGLPNNWSSLQLEETNYAVNNFAVFKTTLVEVDILLLNRDSGHQRMRAQRDQNDDLWALNWITP